MRTTTITLAVVVIAVLILASYMLATNQATAPGIVETKNTTPARHWPGSQPTATSYGERYPGEGWWQYEGLCILNKKVYCRLGYPVIRYAYTGELRDLAEKVKPNITYYAATGNHSIEVGYLLYPVMSLEEVLGKVLELLGGSKNYSLVEAVFEPGKVVGGILVRRPIWVLTLAETIDGYRIWPIGGGDLVIAVDALEGNTSILREAVYQQVSWSPTGLNESLFENITLGLLKEKAIEAIEAAGSRDALEARKILESTAINDISITADLRVISLGPETRNLLTMSPLSSELLGKPRLYWIVWLKPRGKLARIGVVIDALDWKPARILYEQLYPPTRWKTIAVEPAYPGCKPIVLAGRISISMGIVKAETVIIRAYQASPGSTGKASLIARWIHYPAKWEEHTEEAVVEVRGASADHIEIKPLQAATRVGDEPAYIPLEYTIGVDTRPGLHLVPIPYTIKWDSHILKDNVLIAFLVVKED